VELVQKYAISETAKQFRFDEESMTALITELIAALPDEDVPLKERLQAEAEYLGYISCVDPSLKNAGLVLNIDTKYSPKITMYLLDQGTTVTYKVSKKSYQNIPFEKGDVLKFYSEERPKSKKVDGEWVKDPTVTEPWLTNYLVDHNL
jgi:hypothetical protein